METGAGKTFTAIAAIYRLLKRARVRRVLFLVDTRNPGEQAEQEFLAFTPNDDNRRFTALYTASRLNSSFVPADAQVCISTIQRMYSILQGGELDESAENENPGELAGRRREPLPVVYSENVPPPRGVRRRKRFLQKGHLPGRQDPGSVLHQFRNEYHPERSWIPSSANATPPSSPDSHHGILLTTDCTDLAAPRRRRRLDRPRGSVRSCCTKASRTP